MAHPVITRWPPFQLSSLRSAWSASWGKTKALLNQIVLLTIQTWKSFIIAVFQLRGCKYLKIKIKKAGWGVGRYLSIKGQGQRFALCITLEKNIKMVGPQTILIGQKLAIKFHILGEMHPEPFFFLPSQLSHAFGKWPRKAKIDIFLSPLHPPLSFFFPFLHESIAKDLGKWPSLWEQEFRESSWFFFFLLDNLHNPGEVQVGLLEWQRKVCVAFRKPCSLSPAKHTSRLQRSCLERSRDGE